MRAQTKIAVGVGVVLIILGIVYVRSSDKKAPGPVADNTAGSTEQARSNDEATSTPPADASHPPVADVASPAPKQVETPKLLPSGETPRPKPSETDAPAASVSAPTLPSPERTGLSSIPPALPSDIRPSDVTAAPAAPPSDMPPNVDRQSTPPVAVAPPAVPSSVTRSEIVSVPVRGDSTTESAHAGRTAPPIAVATTRPATARTHVVQKGDTYTSLAVKYLGHAKYVNLLKSANPGRDEKHLYIGARINIPEAPATAVTSGNDKNGKTDKAAAKGKPDTAGKAHANGKPAAVKEKALPPDPARAYVVQRGDSWQSLARKFLGKADADAELYDWNKDRVGGDPNLLRTGLLIELPPRAKMPAKPAPTPTTGTPSTPVSATPVK